MDDGYFSFTQAKSRGLQFTSQFLEETSTLVLANYVDLLDQNKGIFDPVTQNKLAFKDGESASGTDYKVAMECVRLMVIAVFKLVDSGYDFPTGHLQKRTRSSKKDPIGLERAKVVIRH